MDISTQIPTHVLSHLINDEEFCRRVIPFLKNDYFDGSHKVIFDLIVSFVTAHNKIPTSKVLEIELTKVNAPDDVLNQANQLIHELKDKTDVDIDYLLAESEKWCQEKAIYNAIMESIQIIDGKKPDVGNGMIPEILSTALGVSFDQEIGHDYIDNSEQRFEFYNKTEQRIPFDLDFFNKMTKNGLPNKTLTIS